MRLRKVAIGALLILLAAGVAGVSASAADAGSAPNTYSRGAQGLALAVPDWLQVNTNGFGDPQTGEVTALEAFNGYLYAGTYNPVAPGPIPIFDGAQIFRSLNGVTWTPVTQPGFGNPHDTAPPAILDMTIFNGTLYAGTGRGNASEIWRSQNGVIWAPMNVTGFGDPDNDDVTALAVFGPAGEVPMIYAGVTNQVTGAQIWRSLSGDSNTWQQVAPDTPGTDAASITGFAEFDGGLYAAVESQAPAQIWRSYGGSWTPIMSDGFGNVDTIWTGGLAVFGGYLYVGAGNAVDGALLYRTNNGATWDPMISPGFGDRNNLNVESVRVFQNRLYVSVQNAHTGIEVWRSTDGTNWERANGDGFGDSNNTGSNRSNATAEFLGHLYVGTANGVDGGELWRMKQLYTYLPLVLR